MDAPNGGRDLRILLIDDDLGVEELIAFRFPSERVLVESVTSGREGLEKARREAARLLEQAKKTVEDLIAGTGNKKEK